MKKAIKINLGGQVFHIDEDAYDKLKIYLDTISSHFSDIQESREILNDIEIRIAELLGEKLKDPNRVVTLKEVNEIIEVMGRLIIPKVFLLLISSDKPIFFSCIWYYG